jgi:hypothetical protein
MVLHRISDLLIMIIDYIPALFLEEHSPNLLPFWAMSTQTVIALLIAVFALLGISGSKTLRILRSRPGRADQDRQIPSCRTYVSEHSNSGKMLRMPLGTTPTCRSPKS